MYFDTDDFALREHGVSLRVRKAGGQRLQTIKTNSSALITGEEWETEIDCDQPKLELAHGTALAPLPTTKLTEQLRPVFETCVERLVIPLAYWRQRYRTCFRSRPRSYGRCEA